MTGKADSHLIGTISSRTCENCGEDKQLNKSNFYFKKDRGDFDKTCTACRKKARTNRYQNQVPNENFPVPQKPKNEPSNSVNPKKLTQDDFCELVSLFEILKEWRDEFRENNPDEFKKKWEV